jgi:hypothetical protein
MDQPCFVCGATTPDVQPAYFRVVGATYLGVAAFVRWVHDPPTQLRVMLNDEGVELLV